MARAPARGLGRQARTPPGRKYASPMPQQAVFFFSPPFKVGVLLFARVPKADHIASIEPTGRGQVSSSPGYRLGMTCGNRSFTLRRTISSAPHGARARCLSTPKPPSGKHDSKPLRGTVWDTKIRNSKSKPRLRSRIAGSVLGEEGRTPPALSESPGPRARETWPKMSSMTVGKVCVDGVLGAITHPKDLRRGRSHPETQTTVSGPSWLQRVSQTGRMPVWACLTEPTSF